MRMSGRYGIATRSRRPRCVDSRGTQPEISVPRRAHLRERPMDKRQTWTPIKEQRPDTPARPAGYARARGAYESGAKVRDLREARGLTQAELARRMGATQSTVARLEAGGVEPRIDTLD